MTTLPLPSGPVPRILLIRHGQASFGAADYDALSERGHAQAALTVEALARQGVRADRIVTGSLTRQRETAAPIGARLGASVDTDPRWNEYAIEALLAAHPPAAPPTLAAPPTPAAFQALLESSLTAWIAAGAASPAPESYPAFRARTDAALRDLAADLRAGQTAIVVSSGGVIAAVCATLLELPTAGWLSLNRVAVNTAITRLSSGRRGLSLLAFNEQSHLGPDPGLLTYR
ncbi:histidine phosphatase family protein [Conexibacter sp. DBS9H8]|uniref:histidine phosphatase family protein n=1 Tax=Conexibacter sp. DBS9H8 TaxID=2937801 RepID=UPI00200F6C3D|nr:histidine phosphatase family protein [Conexibacter sp. DBS9H8]